jgi:molecular chaperone DnaK
LSHDKVRRAVPEGSEIEMSFKVDPSRRTTVTAFVPHLNQHFSFGDELYVAQREEQNFAELSGRASAEADSYRERLDKLESTAEDDSTQSELRQIRAEVDEIERTVRQNGSTPDPDSARRIVETSRVVRGKLSRLESTNGSKDSLPDAARFVETVENAEEVINQFGSPLEKQQFGFLKRELEKAAANGNSRAAKRAADELDSLRWRILFRHDWFWREIFDSLCEPATPFSNGAQAESLVAKGKACVANGDGQGLREVVRSLWKLQPQSEASQARERAMGSGLRKY